MVQQFVADPAVETLREGVVGRLAQADGAMLDTPLLAPRIEHPPRELGSVVRAHRFGLPAEFDGTIEDANDPLCRHRNVAVECR